MAKVLTVLMQKGGVSKTTTTVTIADALSSIHHKRTLVYDTDPQGHAAVYLGKDKSDGIYEMLINHAALRKVIVKVNENLWVVPSYKSTVNIMGVWTAMQGFKAPPNTKLAEVLAPLKQNDSLDYIIIDTGPTVGGLQDQAIYAADGVLIPVSTDYASLDSLKEVWDTLQLHKAGGWQGKVVGILPTMYEEGKNESEQSLRDIQDGYGSYVLPPIHYTIKFKECVAAGETVIKRSGGEYAKRAADEYLHVVNKIMEVL
jgi:chromosome partitioning protein